MRWNTSTRLALYAAVEMARAGDGLVTAAGVAEKHGISAHHLAKVLQQLVRAGIAQAVRGVGGGYRLARPAKEITLLQIVEQFEGTVDLDKCLLQDARSGAACGDSAMCRLKRVFDEIDRQALFTLQSVRLSTVAG
ncbi:MAG: Rrf2 family transcriptional regulator [Planctomycetes bacterium]|nr:Rrf2 family transcriptional regulator [Planctomycetota bacterium]